MPSANPSSRYCDDGYNGATESYYYTEQISYHTKVDEKASLPYGMPKYYYVSSKTNACSVVSAATLLGYYDINFTNLIPSSNPLRTIMGKQLYSPQVANVQDAINARYNFI